ncbi:MAG: NAD-dependent epimerase/dehydratase family protein [Patescibacteria group bacterium]
MKTKNSTKKDLQAPSNPQKLIDEDIARVIRSLGSLIDELDGARILITGSNGLLGSYIVDTIKALNKKFSKHCKVLCLNRSIPTERTRNFHLLRDPNFSFLSHDVSKPPDLSKFKPDYMFLCAGSSTPKNFQADELLTIDLNINGVRWALEYAKNNKVKGILYFSSGAVYGDPPADKVPTSESYNGNVNTLSPRACYSESKRLSETLCSIFAKKYSVPVYIARIFVTYGPGVTVNDGKVLSDFLKQVLDKKPIVMKGSGEDIRSDCYVSDATEAFFRIILTGRPGEAYNVGSDLDEYSIKEMASLLHRIRGVKGSPKCDDNLSQEYIKSAPKRFCPDISKLKNELGYKPKIDVYTGLQRTVEWNICL